MDPDAALAKLRRLLAKYDSGEADTALFAEEFAETFRGLDEWLSHRGFLPDAWQANR